MNTNFAPDITIRFPEIPEGDLPKRLTDRFQRIFTTAIDGNAEPTPNYQTLTVLGELAVVSGLAGTVASYYFQSHQYLPECIINIALGTIAIGRGLRG